MGKTNYLVKVASTEEITDAHEYYLSEHLETTPVSNTKTKRTRTYKVKAWPYQIENIIAELNQSKLYKVTFTEISS